MDVQPSPTIVCPAHVTLWCWLVDWERHLTFTSFELGRWRWCIRSSCPEKVVGFLTLLEDVEVRHRSWCRWIMCGPWNSKTFDFFNSPIPLLGAAYHSFLAVLPVIQLSHPIPQVHSSPASWGTSRCLWFRDASSTSWEWGGWWWLFLPSFAPA